MDNFNFLRMANPATFDYSKRKVIDNETILTLPAQSAPNHKMDELRVRNFVANAPRPRQIPTVDVVEQERLKKYGMRVDVDPEAIAEKMSKMALKLPFFGPDGQPMKDQTGRVVYRYMTFNDMLKGVNVGGLGLLPGIWRLARLVGVAPRDFLKMKRGRLTDHIKYEIDRSSDAWEIQTLVASLSPHIPFLSAISPVPSGTVDTTERKERAEFKDIQLELDEQLARVIQQSELPQQMTPEPYTRAEVTKKLPLSPEHNYERTLKEVGDKVAPEYFKDINDDPDRDVPKSMVMDPNSQVSQAVHLWLLRQDPQQQFNPETIMEDFLVFIRANNPYRTDEQINLKEAFADFYEYWYQVWTAMTQNRTPPETKVQAQEEQAAFDLGVPGNPRVIGQDYYAEVPFNDRRQVFEYVWRLVNDRGNKARDQWVVYDDLADFMKRIQNGALEVSFNSPNYIAPIVSVQPMRPMRPGASIGPEIGAPRPMSELLSLGKKPGSIGPKIGAHKPSRYKLPTAQPATPDVSDAPKGAWPQVDLTFSQHFLKKNKTFPKIQSRYNPFMRGSPKYIGEDYLFALEDESRAKLVKWLSKWGRNKKNKQCWIWTSMKLTPTKLRESLVTGGLTVVFKNWFDMRIVRGVPDELKAAASPPPESKRKKDGDAAVKKKEELKHEVDDDADALVRTAQEEEEGERRWREELVVLERARAARARLALEQIEIEERHRKEREKEELEARRVQEAQEREDRERVAREVRQRLLSARLERERKALEARLEREHKEAERLVTEQRVKEQKERNEQRLEKERLVEIQRLAELQRAEKAKKERLAREARERELQAESERRAHEAERQRLIKEQEDAENERQRLERERLERERLEREENERKALEQKKREEEAARVIHEQEVERERLEREARKKREEEAARVIREQELERVRQEQEERERILKLQKEEKAAAQLILDAQREARQREEEKRKELALQKKERDAQIETERLKREEKVRLEQIAVVEREEAERKRLESERQKKAEEQLRKDEQEAEEKRLLEQQERDRQSPVMMMQAPMFHYPGPPVTVEKAAMRQPDRFIGARSAMGHRSAVRPITMRLRPSAADLVGVMDEEEKKEFDDRETTRGATFGAHEALGPAIIEDTPGTIARLGSLPHVVFIENRGKKQRFLDQKGTTRGYDLTGKEGLKMIHARYYWLVRTAVFRGDGNRGVQLSHIKHEFIVSGGHLMRLVKATRFKTNQHGEDVATGVRHVLVGVNVSMDELGAQLLLPGFEYNSMSPKVIGGVRGPEREPGVPEQPVFLPDEPAGLVMQPPPTKFMRYARPTFERHSRAPTERKVAAPGMAARFVGVDPWYQIREEDKVLSSAQMDAVTKVMTMGAKKVEEHRERGSSDSLIKKIDEANYQANVTLMNRFYGLNRDLRVALPKGQKKALAALPMKSTKMTEKRLGGNPDVIKEGKNWLERSSGKKLTFSVKNTALISQEYPFPAIFYRDRYRVEDLERFDDYDGFLVRRVMVTHMAGPMVKVGDWRPTRQRLMAIGVRMQPDELISSIAGHMGDKWEDYDKRGVRERYPPAATTGSFGPKIRALKTRLERQIKWMKRSKVKDREIERGTAQLELAKIEYKKKIRKMLEDKQTEEWEKTWKSYTPKEWELTPAQEEKRKLLEKEWRQRKKDAPPSKYYVVKREVDLEYQAFRVRCAKSNRARLQAAKKKGLLGRFGW